MLGIVIPVWLTDCPVLWDSTRRAVSSLKGTSDARLYLVPNRFVGDIPTFIKEVEDLSGLKTMMLEVEGARSVAASWNQGIKLSQRDGCDMFLVTANDCYWHPGAIDQLVEVGKANPDIVAWSGCGHETGRTELLEACDFTGVMLRSSTFDKIGWFDEHYRPAYFEDNDYCTRIVQANEKYAMLPTARFDHAGSLTSRSDAEAAHHCSYWFEINRQRFAAKWGTGVVPTSRQDCIARCFATPWNNPKLTIKDWNF